jgi:hypothetical protein
MRINSEFILKLIGITVFIFIFLFSVCIIPATQQFADNRGDLRAAITLAKELSTQAENNNTNFSDTFIKTITALRHLSGVKLTLNENNDTPEKTIILSSRSSYLLKSSIFYAYVFFSYDVSYEKKKTLYTSLLLPPEVPPPVYC